MNGLAGAIGEVLFGAADWEDCRENGRKDSDGPHGTLLGKQHQDRFGGAFGGSGNGQFHLHLVAHRCI